MCSYNQLTVVFVCRIGVAVLDTVVANVSARLRRIWKNNSVSLLRAKIFSDYRDGESEFAPAIAKIYLTAPKIFPSSM
jgi:hypothetical protein